MNVISEPLRLSGHPAVVAWIDAQNVETLYLSAISLAELRFGVAALSNGKRKDTLHRNLERSVVPLFTGRILPFDAAASEAYADIMARAKSEGKAIGKADGYIAAIAEANGLIVATRDTSPFEAAGLTVINPWKG
ncbi:MULTISPECIES: type II toxin-antitoxin system VapC family toxin [Photorhabdus]|uniref:type II toxin-antitoxin system VapC family toxin n=1 Tax=Photorhabdus TaxID=29487 RepID=UPI0028F6F4A0|nr:type II toxin-antitoxin system VapC family toxin [Photorhabdus kleinii]